MDCQTAVVAPLAASGDSRSGRRNRQWAEAVRWTNYFQPILLEAERPVLTAIQSFKPLG
jgi:hypothetical protein